MNVVYSISWFPVFSTSCHRGFVPRKSCVTQLLTALHDLGKTLDAGHESDVLFLDFSKAFDSVPHNLLLHKLSLYGIGGPLHRWFSDYLHSRSQRVLIDGSFSTWAEVTSGVPQEVSWDHFCFCSSSTICLELLATNHLLLFSLMMPNALELLSVPWIVTNFNTISTNSMTGPLHGAYHIT